MQHQPRALPGGSAVDRFTIGHVIAVTPSSITYRATDARSSTPFILREYLPPGPTARGSSGQLRAEKDNQQAEWLLTAAAGVARFLAESSRATTLHHAAITPASRAFKANNTAYLVMARSGGECLQDRIRQDRISQNRALSPGEVAGWIPSLLDALEYLHAQGIIHQEIAPHSIYIDAANQAVLHGIGVAVRRDRDDACAPLEQVVQGEVVQGQVLRDGPAGEPQIGPYTDIYALSAVLYQAVSGHPPPTATARREALRRGQADPLQPLPAGPATPAAARELAVLIGRGLALEPSARPQSVHEWNARIKYSPGSPATKSADSQPRPSVEERQWLPKGLLAILLLAMAGLAYYLLSDVPPRPASRTEAAKSASESDQITREEAERWRQALVADALVGYRAFTEDFPDSIHVTEALQHIDRLEEIAWQQVLVENTRAGYEAHLESFPEGRHATEALAQIEEFRQAEARAERERMEKQRQDDLAWDKARSAGSLGALDQYLNDWPGGTHVEQARALRQKLQSDSNDAGSFAAAAKEHTIAAYRTYIAAYPAGRHVAAAQQSIDELTLRSGKTFSDCSDCPTLVVIPAGSFWQGSAEASALALNIEKPRRRVTIAQAFAVSVYEISLAQWDACVADQGCDTRPVDNGWGRGSRPVIMVSWNDAMQYAEWLSNKTGEAYSLPSESEWEYLARSGEETDWLGGGAAALCSFGNIAGNETGFDWRHTECADNAALETMPAGSYRPNAFGVYDVIGNVAEWTLDCMNLSYLDAPVDGSAWSRGLCSSRMTRGGSWFTGAKESRLPARFNLKNGDRNDFTGFRLVRRVEIQ